MKRFRTLVGEIHRRSLWQVLTIYLVGSWVGYQVIFTLTEGLGLPGWVPGFAVALFIMGLPVVLATAFIQEGGPRSGSQTAGDERAIEGLEPTLPLADEMRPPATPRAPDAARPPAARMFTWSRAITAGVLAFALLGLATTGFMGMRTLGIGPAATLMSSGVMEARDPIILADFGNTTADDRLGEVVTEALRIDLHSSPVIELVSEARIRETLGRMRRSGDESLDTDLALEVAARDGNKAVISGEVGAVGSGFVLTARVLSTESGSVLAGFRETAAGEADLLPAIDRLSGAIRAKVGESLRSTRASDPLDQVTTSSLEALRLYSRASRIADREAEFLRAIALLQEAVGLDPGFAMAHRKIGVLLSNLGVQRDRMVDAVSSAYELRDRLNERERGLAIAFYHRAVAGDNMATIGAYLNLLDRYPDDQVARNNLALAYNEMGDHAAAIEVLRPAIEAGQLSPTQYFNLIDALWGLERAEEALTWLAEVEREYPRSSLPRYGQLLLFAADHGWAEAEAALAGLAEAFPTSPVVRARVLMEGYMLDAAQGRLGAALAKTDQLAALAASLDIPSAAAEALARGALVEAAMTADPDRVEARIARLEARYPDSVLPALDRPHLPRVRAWLQVGAVDRAEAAFEAYEADVPADRRGHDRADAKLLGAVIAVERGEIGRGIAEMEAALPDLSCRICGLAELGRAHERADDPAEAIRYYTEYLETQYFHRLWPDHLTLPFVLQRLAGLHEVAGDTAAAARYYGRFVSLWKDADPELQPQVESASRRLAALVQEG